MYIYTYTSTYQQQQCRHSNAGAHSHKSFKSKRYFSGERLEPRPRLLAATSPHLANQLIILIHIPFAIQLST